MGQLQYSMDLRDKKHFITIDNNGDSMAYVSQSIADLLTRDGSRYFNGKRDVRVAIGFNPDERSKGYALQMSRILAASNIAVTLVDDAPQPFMLREVTRTWEKEENMYDLAFHISPDEESSKTDIRFFEKGITAFESFLSYFENAFNYREIGNSAFYENIKM